ncbi:MAG: acyl-CoA thioester hydrolase/BAAT C-terminal domain-containing protein [Pseudomonadota bacterium]
MAALTLEEFGGHGPVYGPATGAALPGVVILHGAEGPMAGWAHRFAAILAVHGFLALPLGYGAGDFFGAGPIRDVDLRAVPAAVAALAAHPRCCGAGLFGWSRGGEMALLAAVLAGPAAIPALALHAPSDTVNGAFDPEEMRRTGRVRTADPNGPRAWVWAGEEAALTPGAPIEIERYEGPVFLSVGTADEVWDHRMTLRLADRLAAAGRPADLLLAEGEGHGYSFPREPELWARLIAFFERALP